MVGRIPPLTSQNNWFELKFDCTSDLPNDSRERLDWLLSMAF